MCILITNSEEQFYQFIDSQQATPEEQSEKSTERTRSREDLVFGSDFSVFDCHVPHIDAQLGVVLSHVVVGYVGVGYQPAGVLGDSRVGKTGDSLFEVEARKAALGFASFHTSPLNQEDLIYLLSLRVLFFFTVS